MAVVVITKPPQGVTEEMYDAVNEKLGDRAPAGLLVHTAGRNEDGEFQIVDLWESREAHDRFAEGRLGPAIAAMMADRGEEMSDEMPRRTSYEAHNVMIAEGAAATV
jgi:hypothetical protein